MWLSKLLSSTGNVEENILRETFLSNGFDKETGERILNSYKDTPKGANYTQKNVLRNKQ